MNAATPVETLVTDHLDLWTAALKRKSTAGRGSSSKVELYGIKKLRELILELAVRGLLVPQDSGDEPASELLKKIAAEKAKLVKEGKIKKDKPLPPISNQDLQIALPNGWSLARLGSFVSIVRGITFPASEKNSEPAPGLVACLRTANVQAEIDWEDLLYIDSSFIRRDDQYLHTGDIVMSMANSRELVGKVSYVGSMPVEQATFGGFLGVIRPYQLRPSYLMCFLRAPQVRASLIDSASQTTNIANISLEKLNPLAVALPPLTEQHRIVAKVDELMALCDQLEQQADASLGAHQTLVETLLSALTSAADHAQFASAWQRIAGHFDTLFTTEESIDQLKQTILQLAVMGKLVPQDPNDEPASELLKKIAAEKAKLVKEGKIKKDKGLPEIAKTKVPFGFPSSWECVGLQTIAAVGTGATPARDNNAYYHPPAFSWVTSGETSQQFVSETREKISAKAVVDTNVTIYPPGTLIVAMYGQGRTRGQITELLIPAGTNQACAAIQLIDPASAHRSYIKIFFQKAYEDIRSLAEGGAQPNLNVGKISETVLPLPPLPEQHRIVAKVDELMVLCDQLKSRLSDAQTTQLHLADALVEQAIC